MNSDSIKRRLKRLVLLGALLPLALQAQVYKDRSAPIEERVRDLLSRMTPEEKFGQLFMVPGDLTLGREKLKNGLFGLQISAQGRTAGADQPMLRYSPGAAAAETARTINEIQRFFVSETRLGIPIIPFDEALHGLIRSGATAFPQSIGLAATFDVELMGRLARAIAEETRTRGIRQILSPVINIASDVRWGRVEETYGEDPFLTSEMGVAFVSGFERAGVIATPKHLIANVGDGGRDSYPIHGNERYLREIHWPPFQACLARGGARSMMTSYNSYDGQFCSGNDGLLNGWLKGVLGFKGFVISDANAVGGANVLHMTSPDYARSGAAAVNGGLDVIFQTSIDHQTLFRPAFFDGSIAPATIDKAVARVLRAKFELGLFENPTVDPQTAASANGGPAHRALALEAARKSIVLLKNEARALPLSRNLRRLAVLGPEAAEARLGGYSGPGIEKISILEGIRKRAGSGTRIVEARGCGREVVSFVPVPGGNLFHVEQGSAKPGLRAEYFANVGLSGQPVMARVDPQIRFQWTLFGPDPARMADAFFSVRWTGRLKSPGAGNFRIGIDGNDGYRVYLDGRLIIDNWIKRTRRTVTVAHEFQAGQTYDLRIEYFEPTGNAWFTLVWNAGIGGDGDAEMAKAVEAAASCDAAVVAVGIEEGEFRDRASLRLPGRQEELIRKVAATGKPVVVVLIGGSAIVMNEWLDAVPAVVEAWYPGEAGGEAVAGMLFGDENPAGRLPITFPVAEGQLPLVYNHKPTGRGDDYLDLTGQPLFPFGFGLSYAQFKYGDLRLDRTDIHPDETTRLRVRLTQAGGPAGEEVVQLYIRDVLASVARPVLELKGFQRVFLKPGESREIVFDITPELLTMLDKDLHPIVEPGDFRLMVGSSSKDIRAVLTLRVTPR
jgi:beta-glucosidase